VDPFTIGRIPAALATPFEGDGLLFASQLCNDEVVPGPTYANCTFANVSFLRTKISHGTFRNCVFIECYFRKSELRGSTFVGCKFINCNFTHITIRDCDFRYAEFRGTTPPFRELVHSAPQQANLRYELFNALSRVAESAGSGEEARRYRLAGIEALDKHLRSAVKADSSWYKEHFDVLGRLGALLRLAWHHVNRVLWGHGESAWRLLASASVTALIVFPVLFVVFQNGVGVPVGEPTAPDYLWVSLSNFLLLDRISDVVLTSWVTQSLSSVEALLGVVFAGMYVTLLVKALLRR
jgi:hypothetical protein